jgi:hypothetical protein
MLRLKKPPAYFRR